MTYVTLLVSISCFWIVIQAQYAARDVKITNDETNHSLLIVDNPLVKGIGRDSWYRRVQWNNSTGGPIMFRYKLERYTFDIFGNDWWEEVSRGGSELCNHRGYGEEESWSYLVRLLLGITECPIQEGTRYLSWNLLDKNFKMDLDFDDRPDFAYKHRVFFDVVGGGFKILTGQLIIPSHD
ncbi:uncharacterized protein LOC135173005 [Diachasmimorpha longicaudata]|uniref:uncharacterized protein LOC135173005 n=1 Tax=Diachasmimorpha longicaudata TaxID=58733 RepID=UPI0030B8F7F8